MAGLVIPTAAERFSETLVPTGGGLNGVTTLFVTRTVSYKSRARPNPNFLV